MGLLSFIQALRKNKKRVVIFLTPLILLPLAMDDSLVAKGAFGLLVVGIYWITEALPLFVTALLPLVLFPVLGVEKINTLGSEYLKVDAGFDDNYFISMWIPNSATAVTMFPISGAIFLELLKIRREEENELKETDKSESKHEAIDVDNIPTVSVTKSSNDQIIISRAGLSSEELNLGQAFSLSVSYAATTGGTATLTGTGTNVIMKGLVDEKAGGRSGVTFNSWMMFSVPVVVINLILCWVWLQIFFFGPRAFFTSKGVDTRRSVAEMKQMLLREYKKLGPVRFAEVAVTGHFLVMVVLWITYDSELFGGWATLFKPGFPGIAIPAILVMTVMFFFPSNNPLARATSYTVCNEENAENLQMRIDRKETVKVASGMTDSDDTLLTWDVIQTKMPWGILLLMGGGFALAKACDVSGLSAWIGEPLSILDGLPDPLVGLLLALFISFLTEITNNGATVTITQPLLFEMARSIKLHPLYFMMPCALASSYAYMLPCAGIPNALAFSQGLLGVTDMVKAGFVMNVMSVLVLSIGVNTWGDAVFHFDNIPAWGIDNSTLNNTFYPIA